jgi:hypothetical protein
MHTVVFCDFDCGDVILEGTPHDDFGGAGAYDNGARAVTHAEPVAGAVW